MNEIVSVTRTHHSRGAKKAGQMGAANGRVADAIIRPCKSRNELGNELRLQFDCGCVLVQAVLYQKCIVHGGEDSEGECGP